jgi:hypothetical protein
VVLGQFQAVSSCVFALVQLQAGSASLVDAVDVFEEVNHVPPFPPVFL